MARLTKKQEKSVLAGLTLMDDALFTMCFDGSAECASVMLSVLLCRDDLIVTEATTQKWIEGADKHSVKLDIYARDEADGGPEVPRSEEDALQGAEGQG